VFALVVGGDVGLVPDDEQVVGVLALDQQADESGCVTGEVDPLDAVEQDAAVAVKRPPVEVVVEVGGDVRAVAARLRGEVGVFQLALVDEDGDVGAGELLEAARVVDVEVRLDDVVDVPEVVADRLECPGQRMAGGVLRNRRFLMGCGNRFAISERRGA
jgi:hypothetical protein